MSQPATSAELKSAQVFTDLRGAILNVENLHTGEGDIVVIEKGL